MRRRTPRQARSEHTVDMILTAAAQVLVERGYAKTSTNHVAKVAGVSIGSLYQYFGNKDELILAVVNRHAQGVLGLLKSTMADFSTNNIESAVHQFVDAMIAAHAVNPRLHRVCLEQILNLGIENLMELRSAAVAIVREQLSLRRDDIDIKDLDTAAFVLVVTVDSVVHSAFMGSETPELECLSTEITRLILRYLGVTSESS
ncbi:MAG: TetR/AcrR family transcriptional regulator [Myxococcota bacterium]|nr:TetR/AcrR family transcriptional regulator [Myxococcota bacterium]